MAAYRWGQSTRMIVALGDPAALREAVIQRANILAYAAEAGFKPRGTKWLCGFHPDRNPSAKVYGKKIHCFRCAKSWDVIGLAMHARGISFRSALDQLAIENGVHVKAPTRQEKREYARLSAALDSEAREFAAWRTEIEERLRVRKHRRLREYHRALRFLMRTAQDTVMLPESERVDAFLRLGKSWRIEFAEYVIENYLPEIDRIDAALDYLLSAPLVELLPLYRNEVAAEV